MPASTTTTSVAGTSATATTSTTVKTTTTVYVGSTGLGLFGKKCPKWYKCVVKADNGDGTIKVQWDDDKKYTKRLPVANFRCDMYEDDDDDDFVDIPMNIFASTTASSNGNDDGDY